VVAVEEDIKKIHDTVDGRNPAKHLGGIKACKSWDKLPIKWCRISSINIASMVEVGEFAGVF